MFLAHLPAGYLLGRALRKRLKLAGFPGLELLASVLPDLDLAWFYLIDERRTLHHKYWPHMPWCWLLVCLVWIWGARTIRRHRWRAAGWLVLPNVFGHLLLDSVVGRIDWFAPFSSQSYSLFTVQARSHPWVFNYVLHWSFLLELAIVAWAGWVFGACARRAMLRTRCAPAPRARELRAVG